MSRPWLEYHFVSSLANYFFGVNKQARTRRFLGLRSAQRLPSWTLEASKFFNLSLADRVAPFSTAVMPLPGHSWQPKTRPKAQAKSPLLAAVASTPRASPLQKHGQSAARLIKCRLPGSAGPQLVLGIRGQGALCAARRMGTAGIATFVPHFGTACAAPQEPSAKSHPTAFPEHVKQVPLTPEMDKAFRLQCVSRVSHASCDMSCRECQEQGFKKYKKYDESMGPFPETWRQGSFPAKSTIFFGAQGHL